MSAWKNFDHLCFVWDQPRWNWQCLWSWNYGNPFLLFCFFFRGLRGKILLSILLFVSFGVFGFASWDFGTCLWRQEKKKATRLDKFLLFLKVQAKDFLFVSPLPAQMVFELFFQGPFFFDCAWTLSLKKFLETFEKKKSQVLWVKNLPFVFHSSHIVDVKFFQKKTNSFCYENF